MANAIATAVGIESRLRAESRAMPIAAVRWYVWCLVAASTSATFGNYWDICWHISIGRDTFWTPAHMAVYLAGVLAGIACGYTILTTTFGSSFEAKQASVQIWGLRGPLGCFFAAWGGGAMLASAPFDNWWHGAYGLDVKILSLPHVVLACGIAGIHYGALMLVCSEANRASGENRSKLDRLLLYTVSVVLIGASLFSLENTWPGLMHSSRFYFAAATAFPLILVLVTRISQARWAATTVAAVYTLAFLLGLWIFPLFPAEPKLGPVYQHITHFVPLGFPILLVVPAFAIDLLRHRLGERWGSWKSAALAGAAFLAALVAAQWLFADFLVLSPMARNPIFGMAYFGYNNPANILYNPYKFFMPEKTHVEFLSGMIQALAAAMVFSGLGMALGNWMRRLKR